MCLYFVAALINYCPEIIRLCNICTFGIHFWIISQLNIVFDVFVWEIINAFCIKVFTLVCKQYPFVYYYCFNAGNRRIISIVSTAFLLFRISSKRIQANVFGTLITKKLLCYINFSMRKKCIYIPPFVLWNAYND